MWPTRYFSPRYWAGRYWSKVGSGVSSVSLDSVIIATQTVVENQRTVTIVDQTRTYDWPTEVIRSVTFEG